MAILTVRLFISSPGDVVPERETAARVIEQLQGEFAAWLKLDPYFWEHEPMLANRGDYQENIPTPGEFDIFICLLWSRLGSRLHPRHRRSDGTDYPSGTAFEFENALAAAKRSRSPAHPHGVPDMLVFIKRAEPHIPLTPREVRDELQRQYDALQDWIETAFRDTEEAAFNIAANSFCDLGQFELQLEKSLRTVLKERIPADAAPELAVPVTWSKGCPFRGLRQFDVDDAPVFFGRSAAIDAVLTQWRYAADHGLAFVLIFGSSGVGKSSLARAGVLPMLLKPGVIEGAALWRYVILQPRDARRDEAAAENADDDLFSALARGLLDPKALPELAHDGTSVEWIARQLRRAPGAIAALIKGGLSQAAETLRQTRGLDKQPAARLVILVDQLEELWTLSCIGADEREGFLAALETLAQCGFVWVFATLRSDFFPRCETSSTLMRLKAGNGQYHLQPPGESAIGQIIRWPANAAGLRFEENRETGERLDDLLRDEALKSPEALPLLSHALEQLWECRSEHGLLQLADYRTMGGLEGALRQQAERTYEAFAKIYPGESERVFNVVMRRLVKMEGSPDHAIYARRWASKAECEENEAERVFVEEFIKARLFVAGDGSEEAAASPVSRFTVAHEALLRVWPRVERWLADNRESLRRRARLATASAEWRHEGKRTVHLATGVALAEAREFYSQDRRRLSATELEFVARSIEHNRRRMVVAFSVAAMISLVMGILAIVARRAEHQAQRLLSGIDQAHGQDLIEHGDAHGGVAFLARAIDEDPTGATAAADRLWFVLVQRHWPLPISKPMLHQGAVASASFSPDGTRVLTVSRDQTVRLWDATSGMPLGIVMKHPRLVRYAAFSPDGTRVLTACDDAIVRLWDALTGQPASPEKFVHEDSIFAAAFSTNGRRIASGCRDGSVRVWDVATGERLLSLAHEESVHSLAFHPRDQDQLVTVSGHFAKLWKLAGNTPITISLGHRESVNSARFSPDGELLVTTTDDGQISVWNTADGQLSGLPMQHETTARDAAFSPNSRVIAVAGGDAITVWKFSGERIFSKHLQSSSDVMTVRFSPDGHRLLVASDDGSVEIWNSHTGEKIGEQIRTSGAAMIAEFDPSGARVVVGSADGEARVWQPPSPAPIAESARQPGGIEATAFTQSGSLLLAGGQDGNARIWNFAAGLAKPQLVRPHGTAIVSAAMTRDGKMFATAGADTNARLWSDEGKRIGSDLPHPGTIIAMQFSPDGKMLATAVESRPAQILRWTVPDGQSAGKVIQHEDRITSLAFSLDGKRLLSTSWDKTARCWDTRTGEPATPPLVCASEVTCGALSADGKLIATGAADGSTQLWNSVGVAVFAPLAHGSRVIQLTFSSDSKLLATAHDDGGVAVWNTATGRSVCPNLMHTTGATALAFALDGKRLAVGTKNGLARIWAIPEGQAITDSLPCGDEVRGVLFAADNEHLLATTSDGRIYRWNLKTNLTIEGRRQLAALGREFVAVTLQDARRVTARELPSLAEITRSTEWVTSEGVKSLRAWILSDWRKRPLSPFDTVTSQECIDRLHAEGSTEAMEEAALLSETKP